MDPALQLLLFIMAVAVGVPVVLWLIRQMMLAYWRVNEIVRLLEQIERNTRQPEPE